MSKVVSDRCMSLIRSQIMKEENIGRQQGGVGFGSGGGNYAN